MAAVLLLLAQRIRAMRAILFHSSERRSLAQPVAMIFLAVFSASADTRRLFFNCAFGPRDFPWPARQVCFRNWRCRPTRGNELDQFSVARGHGLPLRVQIFETLSRGRDRQAGIRLNFRSLSLPGSAAPFSSFSASLCSASCSVNFVAGGIQFLSSSHNALVGSFDLLFERRLFRFEIVDLAFSLSFFSFEQTQSYWLMSNERDARFDGATESHRPDGQRFGHLFLPDRVFGKRALADSRIRSLLASAATRALRSSNESDFTLLLPPKTIPSAEMNSPSSVAIARVGSSFLQASAWSNFAKITTPLSNCRMRGSSRARRDDFINRPRNRTFRQTLSDRLMRRNAKFRNEQRGLPKFLSREPPENFFGAMRVFQNNRVKVSS